MSVPKSLIPLAFAVCITALQIVPGISDIVILKLAAPDWVPIIYNVVCIGLVIEVLIRRIHWLWLIPPVLWFGGYMIYQLHTNRQIDRIQAEIDAISAGQTMPFDPATADLVFDRDMPGEPGRILQHFDIPRVFRAGAGLDDRHLASYATTAERCAELRRKANSERALVMLESYAFGATPGNVADMCIYAVTAEPERAVYRVSRQSRREMRGRLPVEIEIQTIRAPGGKEARVAQAAVRNLQVIPFAMYLCPHIGQDSDCSTLTFRRNREMLRSRDPAGQIISLGTVLGLPGFDSAKVRARARHP